MATVYFVGETDGNVGDKDNYSTVGFGPGNHPATPPGAGDTVIGNPIHFNAVSSGESDADWIADGAGASIIGGTFNGTMQAGTVSGGTFNSSLLVIIELAAAITVNGSLTLGAGATVSGAYFGTLYGLASMPTEANVKSGVDFAVATKTGTLAVPRRHV